MNSWEGLAAFQTEDGGWGYVDHTGQIVIQHQLRSAQAFSERLAFVYGADRRAYYIRPDSSRAFDRDFAVGGRFYGGIANVATKAYRSYEYINTKGETVYQYSLSKQSPQ